MQVRAIRRNLLSDCETGSLRNLGVTGDDDEDDDEEDEGNGKTTAKLKQLNHLFRPHRDDPGYGPPVNTATMLYGPFLRDALVPCCDA